MLPSLPHIAQLQEIRTYYKFVDVDNDRYYVNGEYRQVMLSPRELSYAALPARTWGQRTSHLYAWLWSSAWPGKSHNPRGPARILHQRYSPLLLPPILK
jgi:hypothetical protein